MIVTIDGPPGSGKSTAARLLSERLGYPLVSVGSIFRKMAQERGVSLAEFGKLAEKDDTIDIGLDQRTVATAKSVKDIIIEGRLTAPMLQRAGVPALRVYIDAPLSVRAERVAGRDSQDAKGAKKAIVARENSENARYRRLYKLEMKPGPYHDLVIDSGSKTPEQIVDIIVKEHLKWSSRKQ